MIHSLGLQGLNAVVHSLGPSRAKCSDWLLLNCSGRFFVCFHGMSRSKIKRQFCKHFAAWYVCLGPNRQKKVKTYIRAHG